MDPVDQTCNDWLESLGLTPPAATTAGSGGSAGGGSSGGGGGGGGSAATSTARYFSTPSQVPATTECQYLNAPGVNSLCSCTNEITFNDATYGDVYSDALQLGGTGVPCIDYQVFQL